MYERIKLSLACLVILFCAFTETNFAQEVASSTTLATLGTPTITSISPNTGPAAGGTFVTITGTNFAQGITATLGGMNVPVTFVNDRTITFTTPARNNGIVDLILRDLTGQEVTSNAAFTYGNTSGNVPTIISISPNTGPAAGGTFVTITGTNFAQGITATLGGMNVPVTFVNDRTITFTTPARNTGTVDLVLRNSDGQQVTSSSAFTYGNTSGNIPTIISISPNTGPAAGGTFVTITGTNFAQGITARLGGINVPVTFINDRTITFTTPAHNPGIVDLILRNSDGQQVTSSPVFTYGNTSGNVPTIISISPNTGPAAGGTFVTITGTNFAQGITATLGGMNVPITFVNDRTITFTTPAHNPGMVDLILRNSDGQQVTSSSGFIYNNTSCNTPTITSITPAIGSIGGGTDIVISGSNFTQGLKVLIGSTEAIITSVSSTEIKAKTQASTAGKVDVIVRNPDGQQNTLSGGFTYGDESSDLAVQILTPTGGDIWSGGGLASNITWKVTGASNTAKQKIELSMDKGLTFSKVITEDLPSSQTSFLYNVPSDIKTDNARIRITVTDGTKNVSTVSTADFRILPAPTIIKLTPKTVKHKQNPLKILEITGTSFGTDAKVEIDGKETISKVKVKSSKLITIKNLDRTIPGIFKVRVRNSDGSISKEATFTVE